MQINKIKPKIIYQEVSEILHEKIRCDELRPGDRLSSVEQLAEQLQVSRSAIRDALSALKTMGIIKLEKHAMLSHLNKVEELLMQYFDKTESIK